LYDFAANYLENYQPNFIGIDSFLRKILQKNILVSFFSGHSIYCKTSLCAEEPPATVYTRYSGSLRCRLCWHRLQL